MSYKVVKVSFSEKSVLAAAPECILHGVEKRGR